MHSGDAGPRPVHRRRSAKPTSRPPGFACNETCKFFRSSGAPRYGRDTPPYRSSPARRSHRPGPRSLPSPGTTRWSLRRRRARACPRIHSPPVPNARRSNAVHAGSRSGACFSKTWENDRPDRSPSRRERVPLRSHWRHRPASGSKANLRRNGNDRHAGACAHTRGSSGMIRSRIPGNEPPG